MINGWDEAKLGELSDIKTGKKDVNISTPDGKYPFFTCASERYLAPNYSFEGQAILLPGNGANVGKVYYYDGKFEAYQRTYVIQNFSKRLTPLFVYYYLNSVWKDYISNKQFGSATNYIVHSSIYNLRIPIPPLAEQQRIIAKLDEAFAAIDQAKINTEKNLQNAQELFETYLSNIFNNPGVGWEEKRIDEVIQKTETTDPRKKPEGEFIYIDVSGVNNKTYLIENSTKLKGKDAPSRAKKLIQKGDIIFATVRPTLKRVAIIPDQYDGQVCSTGYFVMRSKREINNRLLFYFLLTKDFLEKMRVLQKGASYPAVTDGNLKEQIITFPKAISEQNRIVNNLDMISLENSRLSNLYQRRLVELEALRTSLLQKAFNGEL